MDTLCLLLEKGYSLIKDLKLHFPGYQDFKADERNYYLLRNGASVAAIAAIAALIFQQIPGLIVAATIAGTCAWKARCAKSRIREKVLSLFQTIVDAASNKITPFQSVNFAASIRLIEELAKKNAEIERLKELLPKLKTIA